MENSRLREAASTSVNVTVGQRSREYLTDREVERAGSSSGRNTGAVGMRSVGINLLTMPAGYLASDFRR